MNEDSDNLCQGASKLNINAPVFVPSSFSINTSNVFPSNLDSNKVDSDVNIVDNWEENIVDDKGINDGNENENERTAEEKDLVDDGEEGDEDADEGEEEAEADEEDLTESGDVNEVKKVAIGKRKAGKKGRKMVSESSDKGIKKEHINLVFIGHVDAGKSTIGGQLLYLTGMVDKRTLEKYEREAKEKNRESWYLSWALDTNQEERDKGKTVEVGRAYFETEHKHFTLLDAPGHRGFVPNMICGTSQADLAVLVISARKGEFETGFERGGQTREHAMLAKTAGVKHLIVLVNKMDDTTVQWSEARYNECKEKLMPYLKKCGFNLKTEIYFMPCSGITGAFLKYVPPESVCSWYRKPSFIEYIDSFSPFDRRIEGPFRMPVVDKYKDMGTVVLGKVEMGSVKKGGQLLLMPNRQIVEVIQLWSDEEEVNTVASGENVKIKLKGVEEEEVTSGFVLCDSSSPCSVGKVFDAQVAILEHKSIICSGYSAVLHIHTAVEEITIKAIICLIDKKTGERSKVIDAKPERIV